MVVCNVMTRIVCGIVLSNISQYGFHACSINTIYGIILINQSAMSMMSCLQLGLE